jgi:hypothetical protein
VSDGLYTYKTRHNTSGLFRDSLDSVQDTLETLRHETLAHFGINLLAPSDKAVLLVDIIAAKENPMNDSERYKNDVANHPQTRRRYTLAELLQGTNPEVMAELNADLAWSLDIEPVGRELVEPTENDFVLFAQRKS